MKYHEKNDDNRFMISLAFATVIAVLIIVMPVSKFYTLLGF